ncbi:MAG: ABC transporter permease, partial [Anaerolineales bacterium]|nr:ABC transporter permease [Anaerolineales bacterium]
MSRFILKRLLMLFPVLFGVTVLTFSIAQVTPGDPATIMLGKYATPEKVKELREQLGLDDPLTVQYGKFLWNLLHGDMGRSFRGKAPVLDEILARLPCTAEL